MSLPLIITPESEADIAEARAWYEEKREWLGAVSFGGRSSQLRLISSR
jgi:hypothetical protein